MLVMFLGECTMCMCAPHGIWPKVARSIAFWALQQESSSMLCVCHAHQIDRRYIHYIEIYCAFRSHHTHDINWLGGEATQNLLISHGMCKDTINTQNRSIKKQRIWHSSKHLWQIKRHWPAMKCYANVALQH